MWCTQCTDIMLPAPEICPLTMYHRHEPTQFVMMLSAEKVCGLRINTSKTKTMIFEKGRHSPYDFYLNDVKSELVTSFKYLGIHFFKNGNLFCTQKRIAEHAL